MENGNSSTTEQLNIYWIYGLSPFVGSFVRTRVLVLDDVVLFYLVVIVDHSSTLESLSKWVIIINDFK